MLTFCGVYASDHRHMKCAVARAARACRAAERPRGRIGVGYYAGGEVLLVRRPVGPETGVLSLIGPATGNHVLVGIEDSPPPSFRLESTSPFRFRNFLGLVSFGGVRQRDFAERLLFHVPAYLAREARADVPAELLFTLFLSYVHDMGRIDSPRIAPGMLAEAVRSTLLLLPKLLDGAPVPPVAICIANGDHMAAAALGANLWMRESNEIDACPLCSETERTREHDARVVSHPDVRVVTFVHSEDGEGPEGHVKVPSAQVVVATSTGEIQSRSI